MKPFSRWTLLTSSIYLTNPGRVLLHIFASLNFVAIRRNNPPSGSIAGHCLSVWLSLKILGYQFWPNAGWIPGKIVHQIKKSSGHLRMEPVPSEDNTGLAGLTSESVPTEGGGHQTPDPVRQEPVLPATPKLLTIGFLGLFLLESTRNRCVCTSTHVD